MNKKEEDNISMFMVPLFFVATIFILCTVIIFGIGNPSIKLQGADNVLITVYENL